MNKIQQKLDLLKSQVEAHHYEETLLEANRLLLQAKQINFVSGIINALIIIARIEWNNGNHEDSINIIKEAESYHNNLDNDDVYPEILHIYALNYLSIAQHYTAKKYWLDAIDKAMFTNNMVIEIESLLGIGQVLFSLEEYSRSIEIFELAIKIANKSKNRKLEVIAYILLAKSYLEINLYIDILTVLDLAEDKLDSKQCPMWSITLWLLRSQALLHLGRVKDAKNSAFQAYNISMSANCVKLRIDALICLAKIAQANKNHARALYLSEIAEAIAIKIEDSSYLSKIYLYQSHLYQDQKDYQSALSVFKKYKLNFISITKHQTNNHNLDNNYKKKSQLNLRVGKSVNYLKNHHASDHHNLLTPLISETTWWEKLMLFKASLNNASHSVILFYHENPKVIDECEKIILPLCINDDFLSRLSHKRLGLLIFGLNTAEAIYKKIEMILRLYPWDRKGLVGELPTVSYQDILTFPFTLEQLDDSLDLETLEEC